MSYTSLSFDINWIMDNIPKTILEVFNTSMKIDETMAPILIFTLKDNIDESYSFKLTTLDMIDGSGKWKKMIDDMTVVTRDIQINKILENKNNE